MSRFFDWLDDIAGINSGDKSAARLERVAFVFLFLMVLSAPVSIAATQTAWLLGTAAWLARFFVNPRPRVVKTPLDIALWAFFGWTVLTSVFSYAPDISINKLRGAVLFLIFFFVIGNVRTARAAKFLAFALLFSCMSSVLWSPVQRIYGRGVQVYDVAPESIFAKGTHFEQEIYARRKGKNLAAVDNFAENKAPPLADGDAIVEVDGVKIRTPDELVAAIEKNETAYLECFRQPAFFPLKVRRADLLPGANALEKLGITDWKRNRNWRFSGFYGQIITYAEVLSMIAALALGLFVALDKKRSKTGALLAVCLALMMFAFLLTFTRAAQAAFLVAATVMALVYGNRRTLLTLAAVGLPLVLTGVFFLQQTREVAVYNGRDESVNYRQTVYREGFDLWTKNARNFTFGVGMDSAQRFAEDWRLFDDGKLPSGHFHSTPVQLVAERGLPALLLWTWILWLFGRIFLKRLRITNYELRIEDDWQTCGIILGCFGALVAFTVSSLVNYSLGDGEVAMVFYILMGIGVSLCVNRFETTKEA